MYKLCKTERSTKRQRYIAQKMQEMLYHQSFDEITVKALCEYAGVPRKAFYRYFESKKDILYALADLWLYDLAINQPASERNGPLPMSVALENLLNMFRRNQELTDALQRDGLTEVFFGYLIEQVFITCNGVQHFTVQDSPIQLRQSTMFICGGLITVIVDWLNRSCSESGTELAATIETLLTNPLIDRERVH